MESEYEKLLRRHRAGEVDDQQFVIARNRLLRPGKSHASNAIAVTSRLWGMEEKWFCIAMNLAFYLNFLLPLLGIMVALIMWLYAMNRSQLADQHGMNIINWTVTYVVLGCALVCLSLFVCPARILAIPLLLMMAAAMVIYPIIGAAAAGRGLFWRYPGAVRGLLGD